MTPTEPELAPYWEIDLGKAMFVASVRLAIAAPAGARVRLELSAYPGAPRTPCTLARSTSAEPMQVARCVRVTIESPTPVALALDAVEILAADLDAGSLQSTFRCAFALHRDAPLFLAERGEGTYAPTHTYGAVWAAAMALARSLGERLGPERSGSPAATGERTFVALLLRNRPEWVIADLAVLERGYVSVPLSPDDPDERLGQILERVRPACVVCDASDVDRAARLAPRARLTVVCGAPAPSAAPIDTPERARLEDLVEHGAALAHLPPAQLGPNELYTVLFTSGSTGTPKGAMRSYATFLAMIQTYGVGSSPRHLSFQPLSHLSERMFLPALLLHGARIAFSRGGEHLLDELPRFEPSVLASVPRLYDVLYASYRRRLLAAIAKEPDVPAAEHEARELARARLAFGSRLESLAVGSAPVSPEVLLFLRKCFSDLWVAEGYGSTEVGTIAVDGKIASHVEVKLVPVAHAEPEASERGEIWVRTPHVILGYLGDEQATRASLDSEGFFATGDLGERQPDGSVRVVGRLRSSVKLAHGEFVSAERIEGALATAPGVDRIYVHARPGAAGVVALVVPEASSARSEELLRALRKHAEGAGLRPFEIPRAVLLVTEPFTVQSGLLTASGKLARGSIAERFGDALDALLAGDPGAHGAPGTLVDRVARVVAQVLGRDVDPEQPLSSADIDSLAVAEILAALSDEVGREVPLGAFFECRTLAEVAARIEARAPSEHALERAAAEDLARTAELDPRALERGPQLPLRSILLTGATGFLGAHLIEALCARTELQIVCAVRAASDEAARERLERRLDALEISYKKERLRIVAVDLAMPLVGVRERLEPVGAILHAAAVVSWLAPYSALRAANVSATLELLALATAGGRARPMHFVSTISTAPTGGDETSMLPLELAARGTPYGLSKWIAETHVRRAGERGLPVAIYRPGMIAGHSVRGHGNPDDFVHRYLAGVAELGLYLDAEDARIDLTPVDFVASAIAALLDARPLGAGTYHLVNVDQSPSYAELGRALVRAGVRARPASYAELRERLLRERRSRLSALASFFPERGLGLGMGPWPCRATLEALATLGVVRPPAGEALLARYAAYSGG